MSSMPESERAVNGAPIEPPSLEENRDSSGASGFDGGRVAKPIHYFALQTAIGLALVGWATSESSVYPRLLHAHADALFSQIGTERWLEFSWVDPASRADGSDTLLAGMTTDGSGGSERRWRAFFSVRGRGFWPLATWLFVMAATPMSMLRRLLGLAVGAIALDLWLMGQIALVAMCAFGATEPQPNPLWQRGAVVATALFNSPVPTYSWLFVLWAWMANPAQGISLSGVVAIARRSIGLNRADSH